MHYLIDGHNLIGQMPDIDLSDPDDEIKLIGRLRGWTLADPRRQVTVFFDGGQRRGTSKELSGPLVQVIFSSARYTADALIIRTLERVKNPPEYTVVTNDRAIIRAARRLRVPVQQSTAFTRAMLEEARRRLDVPAPKPPSPKEEPELTGAELEEWLAAFGTAPPQRPRRHVADRKNPFPNSVRRRRVAANAADGEVEAAPELPPRPRDASELKEADGLLTDAEVDEWLALFGEEADQPAPQSPGSPAAGSPPSSSTPKSVRRQKRQKPRPADRMKESGAPLNKDEVDEWLDIFRQGNTS